MSSDHVARRKFLIRNKLGLHARPAALFVRTANRFQCEITVQKGKETINGKSIMGVMTLAAGPGSRVTVTARGVDAKKAIEEIEALIADNFGEQK
ncbi:MAG: phosphocarrier protein HPr [Omnitrophica bacterium RIFCSPLOWO2_12_FULL_50_11]|nr:MAG: phosphocarrier protein HPr [Omnitrophica bacterium RIFCSPLOWO2_12_FULL_50_11]